VEVLPFPTPQADEAALGGYAMLAAGLLVWRDNNNFLRWDRRGLGNVKDGKHYLTRALTEEGREEGAVPMHYLGDSTRSSFLHIERRGDVFTLRRSLDGSTWDSQDAPLTLRWPGQLQVGILAVNTRRNEFAAAFRGLSLWALKAAPQAVEKPFTLF